MGYTDITLTEAENLLAVLLADSAKVRFISDELQTYIIEALRTWAALTGIYEEFLPSIAVSPGQFMIDLPTQTETSAAMGYTIQDRDLLGTIQYHLVEPKNITSWTGTEMFTYAEIINAIERRRDQFLIETRCRVDRSQLPTGVGTIAPNTETYDLGNTVVAIIRAAWKDARSGKISPMWLTSRWSTRVSPAFLTTQRGIPHAYYMNSYTPPSLGFNPPPAAAGMLDLLVVNSGPITQFVSFPPPPHILTITAIPDDFTWAVKWGALADLLAKDGPARDYARSLYCERRYRLGVAAMLTRQTVTDALINDVPMKFTTIDKLDSGRQYWQNLSAQPKYVAPVGSNLVVIADPPDGTYSLTLRARHNCPVPELGVGTDYLPVGREYLDVILGYAAHLAMFKIGGSEFAATTHLANSLFDAAAELNARIGESLAFDDVRFGGTKSEVRKRGVRRVTGATVGDSGSSDNSGQGAGG